MLDGLADLLAHWMTLVVAFWLTGKLFRGVVFESTTALSVAALLLGIVNATVKPLLIALTLPITIVTLGFFLLVLNALMIQLVAALVRGFRVSGFRTAFFASMFISLCSLIADFFLSGGEPGFQPLPGGTWV